MSAYAAHEEASTMEEDENGQALSSWLCIVRMVDTYGDLVTIWSWDSLVCSAFHWDLGLKVPALHRISSFHACNILLIRKCCRTFLSLCHMSAAHVCCMLMSQYMPSVLTAVPMQILCLLM